MKGGKARGAPRKKTAASQDALREKSIQTKNGKQTEKPAGVQADPEDAAPAIPDIDPDDILVDEELDAMLHDIDFLLPAPPRRDKSPRASRRRQITLSRVSEWSIVKTFQSHVDTFERWLLLLSRGISGKTKILAYNLQTLVRCGGFATATLEGTFLTMDNSTVVFFIVMSTVFILVFGLVTSISTEDDHVEVAALEEITTTMNRIVPYLLGLYISLALNRWWTVRVQGLSALFNSASNVVMVVSCVLHQDRHMPVRALVMKWAFASVFLLVMSVRRQSNLAEMCFKGMLTEDEIAILHDVEDLLGRPSVLWGWILRICHESMKEAAGPMPYSIQVAKVCDICMKASDGLSVIDNHLATQLPFVYAHLIALLVDVNNLFFITKSAVAAAVAYETSDWQKLVVEIIWCIVVPVLYRCLLSISYVVFDPFGEDVLDFPIGSYMDWNAQCCFGLLKAQAEFPGVPAGAFDFDIERPRTRRLLSDLGDNDRGTQVLKIKSKLRRILINAKHSGELEEVLRKVQSAKAREKSELEIRAAVPNINQAKMGAAMKSASKSAEPYAEELRNFSKQFKEKVTRLSQQVVELGLAVDKASSAQHQDFEDVGGSLFTGKAKIIGPVPVQGVHGSTSSSSEQKQPPPTLGSSFFDLIPPFSSTLSS